MTARAEGCEQDFIVFEVCGFHDDFYTIAQCPLCDAKGVNCCFAYDLSRRWHIRDEGIVGYIFPIWFHVFLLDFVDYVQQVSFGRYR